MQIVGEETRKAYEILDWNKSNLGYVNLDGKDIIKMDLKEINSIHDMNWIQVVLNWTQ